MQVFELQETSESVIIMVYYPLRNIVDAEVVGDNRYVSAFGQILNGLNHLHVKGVVHRDLKPKNFLVKKDPFFKVIVTDFGLAKIATDTALLKTFCGSLKYMAPEVFPGVSKGHGSLADIWSLGVIVLEWIYGSPKPPDLPRSRRKNERVSAEK